MITQNVRRGFLNYFKSKHHALIASSPVVPHDDPTLLFTNAGMNQFKDVFLGKTSRDYTRAATSQKCIRVGGKHNDLENVGHTSRHLTFFEMIGNFSFGDYFKKEAIQFAFEVSTEVFGFDPERIWPTVFREDDEAYELWKAYVPAARITRFDEKDNFWVMGDTGPCGPCSELLYDRGEKFGSAKKPIEDVTGERFLEFWNLVFMQFNRHADGTRQNLPKPSIDTGAGLERIISLKMNVDNVFETDVLKSLIDETAKISGISYESSDEGKKAAFRVIADHLRALSFAIADGVSPSNVDRGYVLRKVLRRAVRYGRMLKLDDPFLAKILPRLISLMGPDYPELKTGQARIEEILTLEEEAFIRTLKRGGNLLNNIIEKAKSYQKIISGDDAFKLKDTYGLPLEEITLLAKDAGLSVDTVRYATLEGEAKMRSKSVHKATHQIASESLFEGFTEKNGTTEFLGYTKHEAKGMVKGIVIGGSFAEKMQEGEEGLIILDKTCLYPEMGGQVGDTGNLRGDNSLFTVANTESPYKGVIAHAGKLENGTIKCGEMLICAIDECRRQKIANNHTATHLLHFALHEILGEHIKQAGSVVEPMRLRFDFSHHKALSQEEVFQIEDLVNAKIRENLPVKNYELPYEEVQKRTDIKQFFGEKYGSTVRVIDIDYSKELCGGTHTSFVGNIGLFRIAKESSIAAGVRRIEAVTGEEAEALSRKSDTLINEAALLLKTQAPKLMERIEKLIEENKELAKNIKAAKEQTLIQTAKDLIQSAEKVHGISLVATELDVASEDLRLVADHIMEKKTSTIAILAAKSEDRCQMIIRVSDDLVAKGKKAIDMIKILSPIIEGSGGGKAESAQAGGKAPHKIGEALAKAREIV